MSRLALDTLTDSIDVPDCSAALVLSQCAKRFESEALHGTLDTGRYRMSYHVWGRGPAILVIPGLCDDAASFLLPLARLSRSYCCITYDLPTGRGDGAHLDRCGREQLVDDLVALADHLQLTSAIPFGVSFGSTIALAALAREPKRFPVGILQGGFARRPLAWTEVMLARFARYWPGTLSQLPLWLASLKRFHEIDFRDIDPARWDFFLEHHGRAPNSAVAYRALMIHQTDLCPLLPTIRQPVLLITGDRDAIVGQTCAETLRTGLPNVASAVIESCGHVPQFTHPEVLCEVIEQFLSRAIVSSSDSSPKTDASSDAP